MWRLLQFDIIDISLLLWFIIYIFEQSPSIAIQYEDLVSGFLLMWFYGNFVESYIYWFPRKVIHTENSWKTPNCMFYLVPMEVFPFSAVRHIPSCVIFMVENWISYSLYSQQHSEMILTVDCCWCVNKG